jgi:hypothetical protein
MRDAIFGSPLAFTIKSENFAVTEIILQIQAALVIRGFD